MARSSAHPAPSDSLSEAQTDEIRQKGDEEELKERKLVERKCEREKTWIIYFVGFMDLFGVSMMIPLYPKLIRNLGASPFIAGLIGSVYGGLQVFSSPVMVCLVTSIIALSEKLASGAWNMLTSAVYAFLAQGKFSDNYGRKTILLASYIGPGVGYFAVGLSGSLLILILSRIPIGILKHGLSTGKAYLSDISDSRDRQSVLGMYNAITSLGFIFGPLIGGYLADLDPKFQLSLVCGATMFMLNFIIVIAVVPPLQLKESNKSGDKEPSMRPSMNIFKDIHWKELIDLILLQFLMTLSMIIFRNNFSMFLEFHFHLDYKTMGKVISFSAVASAIASATVGRISKLYSNHQTQLIHFTMLLSISLTVISISPSLPISIVFLIPLSLSSSNLRICMLSLQLQRAREDEKGAIIGLSNSINSMSRMLAPTIMGLAQEQSSELAGYVSSGLSLVAVTVMSMYQFERSYELQ